MSASAGTMSGIALVDAHVHLHPGFATGVFLDHAATNFRHAADRLGLPTTPTGCLMLTESAGVDRFAALRDGADRTLGDWHVEPTREACSLRLASDRGELFVVAGRQVVTRERLEVLALGTTQHFEDGEPMATQLQRVLDSGALAVVPWGFGKWTGQRGDAVRRLLESEQAAGLCLGDNGGRLRYGPEPRLFRLARQRGVRVLPGSDPLPFDHQVNRGGSYGFMIPEGFDPDAPFASIRLALEREAVPRTFGSLTGIAGFVRAQVGMHLLNRRRREARP